LSPEGLSCSQDPLWFRNVAPCNYQPPIESLSFFCLPPCLTCFPFSFIVSEIAGELPSCQTVRCLLPSLPPPVIPPPSSFCNSPSLFLAAMLSLSFMPIDRVSVFSPSMPASRDENRDVRTRLDRFRLRCYVLACVLLQVLLCSEDNDGLASFNIPFEHIADATTPPYTLSNLLASLSVFSARASFVYATGTKFFSPCPHKAPFPHRATRPGTNWAHFTA